MDEQTYLPHWIDRFSDEAKSEIAPDWSKNKLEDLNQPFRQKVITQLCDAMKPAPSLALALLEAETEYCEEAESASRDLSLLGSPFFVLSEAVMFPNTKPVNMPALTAITPSSLRCSQTRQLPHYEARVF